MTDSPVGLTGRVTGRIRHSEIGEVSISIRGGTTYYHAYPYNQDEGFEQGEQIVVMEFAPPQTVYVSPAVPRKEEC